MIKSFFFRMLLLTILALALLCTLAAAEEMTLPVNPPPPAGEIPTQWQLFAGQPVDYRLTLQIDEETGLRTYTIQNPADWGIPASALGIWQYTEPTGGWVQTAAEGEQIQLLLGAEAYDQSGFPRWTLPLSDTASLTLTAYLGQVRHLYAYVDYRLGEDEISVYAKDGSFTLSQTRQAGESVITTYASYDSFGILAYASYSIAGADGSLTTYRMEALPQQQTYSLVEVNHAASDGQLLFWTNGQWQNEAFETVDAPQGISTEELPFAITGEWAGIPFAEPGDKPEGTFPQGSMPTDPSLTAQDYQPWPQETDVLYHRWVDAGLMPQPPAASWSTLEDGSVAFLLTGLEKWGVPESSMGDWHWNIFTSRWDRGSESTPAQMTLIIPAGQPANTLTWQQPIGSDTLTLYLSRTGLLQEIRITGADGRYWHMDNQGSLTYNRPLDDRRWLLATYDQYTLLDYSILTMDEAGNLLTQATYSPAEDSAAFDLSCFFLYSTANNYQEYLWLKDIGWYSYLTGEPCDCPQGVDLAAYPPLTVR